MHALDRGGRVVVVQPVLVTNGAPWLEGWGSGRIGSGSEVVEGDGGLIEGSNGIGVNGARGIDTTSIEGQHA